MIEIIFACATTSVTPTFQWFKEKLLNCLSYALLCQLFLNKLTNVIHYTVFSGIVYLDNISISVLIYGKLQVEQF